MKVVWTERSASALVEIGDFIAKDNPEAASRWLARLVQRAEKAAVFPRSGRVVPELGREDVREVFLRTYQEVAPPLRTEPCWAALRKQAMGLVFKTTSTAHSLQGARFGAER